MVMGWPLRGLPGALADRPAWPAHGSACSPPAWQVRLAQGTLALHRLGLQRRGTPRSPLPPRCREMEPTRGSIDVDAGNFAPPAVIGSEKPAKNAEQLPGDRPTIRPPDVWLELAIVGFKLNLFLTLSFSLRDNKEQNDQSGASWAVRCTPHSPHGSGGCV